MEIKGHRIDTSIQEKLFENHLAEKDNLRIFFSGKFGSGKTTFLKNYFGKNEDKYRAIHLFPVNYSVAENRDIFELVKADILMEMMDKYGDSLKFENLDIGHEWAFYFQMKEGLFEMLPSLLKLIPGIGGQLSDVGNALIKLRKGMDAKRQEYSKDELTEVGEFMKDLQLERGSIYELNLVSEIIKGLISQLNGNGNEDEKETVLLIDDMDRIDPGHLFRIMNVFSAHFDHSDGLGNKFGFDKIIFIADHENIKSIYHHFYGLGTDISGYLDKFFSTEIFIFNTNNGVSDGIGNVMESLSFSDLTKVSGLYDQYSGMDGELVEEILGWTCLNSSFSLRSLKKNEDRIIPNLKSFLKLDSLGRPKKVFGVLSFSAVGALLGSMSEFKKAAYEIDFDPYLIDDQALVRLLGILLSINNSGTHNFNTVNEFKLQSLHFDPNARFMMKREPSDRSYYGELVNYDIHVIRRQFEFKTEILKCIDIIDKYGV